MTVLYDDCIQTADLTSNVFRREPLQPDEKVIACWSTAFFGGWSGGVVLTTLSFLRWTKEEVNRYNFDNLSDLKVKPGTKDDSGRFEFEYNSEKVWITFPPDKKIFDIFLDTVPKLIHIYRHNFSEEQIESALAEEKVTHNITPMDVETERKRLSSEIIIGFGLTIFIFIVGLLFGSSLAILGGIVGFIIMLGLVFQRASFSSGSIPKHKTAKSASEKFFLEVLNLGRDSGSPYDAFHLILPQASKLSEVNSPNKLKTTWVALMKDVKEKMVNELTKGNEKTNIYDIWFSGAEIKILNSQGGICDVECLTTAEITKMHEYKKKLLKWRFRFDNKAIEIDGHWYIMSGVPGHLEQNHNAAWLG